MVFRKAIILKLLIFFALITWLYQSNFHYRDTSYACNIKILPSLTEFNTKNILEALQILKHASKRGYKETCENVHRIIPGGSFQGGMFVHGRPYTIELNSAHDQFLGWTAAIIVHEACHSKQRNENRPFSEDECYKRTHETLIDLVVHEKLYE